MSLSRRRLVTTDVAANTLGLPMSQREVCANVQSVRLNARKRHFSTLLT